MIQSPRWECSGCNPLTSASGQYKPLGSAPITGSAAGGGEGAWQPALDTCTKAPGNWRDQGRPRALRGAAWRISKKTPKPKPTGEPSGRGRYPRPPP
jgi:hypothetical protein